jgi:hypothetical protein
MIPFFKVWNDFYDWGISKAELKDQTQNLKTPFILRSQYIQNVQFNDVGRDPTGGVLSLILKSGINSVWIEGFLFSNGKISSGFKIVIILIVISKVMSH